MARRGGDWVPCEEYGDRVEAAGGSGWNIPLVTTVESIFGAAAGVPQREVGTVETGSEAIVNRVVGQVYFDVSGVGGTTLRIIERIRVGIRDNLGGVAFYANDFTNAPDANEPFLWQRVQLLEVGANNMLSSFGHPFWSVIDVRVSRRLKDGMALFWSVEAVGNPGNTLAGIPYLRSWARNV